jgi:hypothetical protein
MSAKRAAAPKSSGLGATKQTNKPTHAPALAVRSKQSGAARGTASADAPSQGLVSRCGPGREGVDPSPVVGLQGARQARSEDAGQARGEGARQARSEGARQARSEGARQARSEGARQARSEGARQARGKGAR